MEALYFAYGSNMSSQWLQGRVPSARALGVAQLRGMRWVCNKLGRDTTAKANLVTDPEGLVWGVLWRFDAGEWDRLDRAEGGYRRIEVEVELVGGVLHRAATYASERFAPKPVPSVGYRALILAGAREHGLPRPWLEALELLPAQPDLPRP